MKRSLDDRLVIEQALAGSQQAYRMLVERYQRPIFALVARMVRDPLQTEDLAQEVFCKAFKALESFDRSRKFSSWLFKIAHNTAIDHLRKQRPMTVVPQTDDPSSENPLERYADTEAETPEDYSRRRELGEVIGVALEALRPEYREILLLRFQLEKSYEEIGEIMGLPLGTVKTHLHRARKALARDLDSQGWYPGGRGN